MSRERPLPGCVELAFGRTYRLGPSAEVALEDYARTLAGARTAEALSEVEDPGKLNGVHLCSPATPPPRSVREDIEAFARELAEHRGSGLGWS
jgi:hypothetical protein